MSTVIREAAIATVSEYFEDGSFTADLAELVSHPTESQTVAGQGALKPYLASAIVPRLERAGYSCEIFSNPEPGGGPFLLAERLEDPSFTTVLTYGHGDVIHAQTEQWRKGLAPFRLTEEGDCLYGRGSADNKAQHLINIAALNAVISTRGALGFNSRILLEMSEETGSAGLASFCGDMKHRLAADVLIASDGPRLQADTPTIFTGARGALNFDLIVELREGAHHSGNWGGLLADPAMILCHALAAVTDVRGQILVPEWRPDSLTDTVRAALSDLPVTGGAGPVVDESWGEESLTPAERAYGWNSFTVLAMTSGVPDAPVNAIAGCARASCQLRFVVGTDAADVVPALRRHLDNQGFHNVRISLRDDGAFSATRLSPDNPWVRFVARSLAHSTGKEPHVLPNLAGSLPNEVFADILGLPTVWVPHSWRGCNQHAPDEHVLKTVCLEGLQMMTGLFSDIAAGGPSLPAPA